jgi:tRNA1(Val) A37 N6-methylase TrmN6
VEYNQELFDAAQPILPNTMSLHSADFIQWTDAKTYDLIIGNPPYVTKLNQNEIAFYQQNYSTISILICLRYPFEKF